jgi:hypothetical protein
MPERTASRRRDRRYELLPGAGHVEFGPAGPQGLRVALTELSICGVTIEPEPGGPEMPDGTILAGRILVGDCQVCGEVVVRNRRTVGDRTAIGGLFRPSSREDELLLAGLIAGLAAGDPGR